MASALRTSVLALGPSEPSLGALSPVDQNWLVAALDHLIKIDKSRRVENAHGNSYCIFEAGRIYFQCLAPSFGTYLRCESVSEQFVPEVANILTQAKRNQLVHEFGFAAPGYSKNFSQKMEIKGKEDLAYVARLAFRVLRDVYDVKDFAATQFKLTLLKPALPVPAPGFLPPPLQTEPLVEKPYVVLVDDNFHFMKEEERYQSGDYATLEEAVKKCQEIVDSFLDDQYKPGMSSDALFEQYAHFGEDPFIRGPESDFSAWNYARQRCDELCRNLSDKGV
jgi:hypothetical protein